MQLTCNKWQVLLLLEPKAPLGQFAILGSLRPKWIVLFWRGFFGVIFWFPESGFKSPGCEQALWDTARNYLTSPLPERQLLWNWERCVSDKQHPPSPACSLFEVACGQKWALSTGLIWVLSIQGLVCCRERLQFPPTWNPTDFLHFSVQVRCPQGSEHHRRVYRCEEKTKGGLTSNWILKHIKVCSYSLSVNHILTKPDPSSGSPGVGAFRADQAIHT